MNQTHEISEQKIEKNKDRCMDIACEEQMKDLRHETYLPRIDLNYAYLMID